MTKKLDKRTESYFNKVKENMKYVGRNVGYKGIREILKDNGVEGKLIKTYDGYANSSAIEIYKYEKEGEERFCAELSYQTNIDDCNTETLIFTKFPSKQDVENARSIEEISIYFKLYDLSPNIICWECGHVVHWLDSPGSIQEKWSNKENSFCGNCDYNI